MLQDRCQTVVCATCNGARFYCKPVRVSLTVGWPQDPPHEIVLAVCGSIGRREPTSDAHPGPSHALSHGSSRAVWCRDANRSAK
eukprot:1628190-Prymnesium_polylepis.1